MRIIYGMLLSLCLVASTRAVDSVKISTSDWPPYVAKQAPHLGYISHLISESFAREGVEVEFIFQPWARAYEEAKDGRIDATSYWYQDKKHDEYFLLSKPLTTEKVVFFRLKSDRPTRWHDLSDFDGMAIGMTRSFTYTDKMWRYAEKNANRVSIVGSDKQNLKMLLLGRIDVTPAEEVVGWHYIHNEFAKEQASRIEVMQPPLTTRTGHLLFPRSKPRSARLLKLFNQGLAALEEDGTLDGMQERLIMGGYSRNSDAQSP